MQEKEEQDYSGLLLEVRTVQSPPFRCLIEALKEILTDANMEFDETGLKDPIDYPDVTMVEIVSTGRYKASYAPDAQGKWRIMVNSASKKGLMVRDHNVVGHNIDSIGNAIEALTSPPMFG